MANYIDPEMVASYNCEMASHIVDFYAAAIVASYNWVITPAATAMLYPGEIWNTEFATICKEILLSTVYHKNYFLFQSLSKLGDERRLNMSVGALFLQTSMRQPLWRFKLKAFLKISPHLTGDCFLCLTLLYIFCFGSTMHSARE